MQSKSQLPCTGLDEEVHTFVGTRSQVEHKWTAITNTGQESLRAEAASDIKLRIQLDIRLGCSLAGLARHNSEGVRSMHGVV